MTASAMHPLWGWEVHVGNNNRNEYWRLTASSIIKLIVWDDWYICENDKDGRLVTCPTTITTRMGGLQHWGRRQGWVACNDNGEGSLQLQEIQIKKVCCIMELIKLHKGKRNLSRGFTNDDHDDEDSWLVASTMVTTMRSVGSWHWKQIRKSHHS